MRRSTNSMGNPNLKVKGFDFLIFCKKKLRQNMLDRGSTKVKVQAEVEVEVEVEE